jgi:hypothetical protein
MNSECAETVELVGIKLEPLNVKPWRRCHVIALSVNNVQDKYTDSSEKKKNKQTKTT